MLSGIMLEVSLLTALIASALFGGASGASGVFIAQKREPLSINILAVGAFIGILISYTFCGLNFYYITFISALLIAIISFYFYILKLTRCVLNTDKVAAQISTFVALLGVGITLYSFLYSNGFEMYDINRFFFGSSFDMLAMESYFLILTSALFLIVLARFFKSFEIISFDEHHAKSMGINTQKFSYIFKGFLILIVLAGLQVTGIFLAGAIFILPSRGIKQLGVGFKKVVLISAGMGALAAFGGTLISAFFTFLPSGPTIFIFCLILRIGVYLYTRFQTNIKYSIKGAK